MASAVVKDLMQAIPAGIRISKDAADLSDIHRPSCAGVIWQRHPLTSFQDWIEGLEPEQLPKARLILRPDAIAEALRHVCDACGTPEGAERDRLIGDISALAEIFSSLMQARFLRLRLDRVTTNACRKFHVDAVRARLVCTYRGTGTQYGTGRDGHDPDRIFTVPASSPLLLRGTDWPETPRSDLLHRSPPIEGSGETRLVLVLDPISDPDVAI